ncbi:GNAT family N-acetyltransferase [uncultured Chitinophaga sp.]|uniref:GNAT family N-acetyltransferase n=1 Tax=uncultured Chitinophaga sp. TaxID=339340 RepID=UPI0025F21CA1|nr:GNAT family N-acetyltransferase [uncultured Chitinophaga sp.]
MSTVNDVRVLSWHPQYKQYFESINRQWIEEKFKMEDGDIAVLQHPEEHILSKGGDIIFVAVKDKIAGTVALRKQDDNTVEMTKLGVDPAFRGYGLGHLLMVEIIERARLQGYTKMVLYSNTVQAVAIQMYRNYGFIEVPVDPGVYERCNIQMEIPLQPPGLKQVAGDIKRVVAASAEKMKLFTEKEATEKRAPDKWSRKEELGHLIDSAFNNHARFIRAQQAAFLETPAYQQDCWVSVQHYQDADWKVLIALWQGVNNNIARVLELIRDESLAHIVSVGDYAPVTLQFLAEDYLAHLEHHLAQIVPAEVRY